ncbi:GAF domain-containing protein [Streptomyces diastatochromogenes]|nr:GAF domain-containing protein [Streptomyces diastatochromogenes]
MDRRLPRRRALRPSGSLDAGVHAPAFDEDAESALRAEGLHAIVAAPLRSGDTVIGVLHGADRRVRHHTGEEIGLLAALADLAALAVEKAGLLDHTRAEVSELERDSARVRTRLTRMRHVSEAHGRIMNLVLAGGDLCHVAKAASDALDATVLIRDPGGRPLAGAGDIPASTRRPSPRPPSTPTPAAARSPPPTTPGSRRSSRAPRTSAASSSAPQAASPARTNASSNSPPSPSPSSS